MLMRPLIFALFHDAYACARVCRSAFCVRAAPRVMPRDAAPLHSHAADGDVSCCQARDSRSTRANGDAHADMLFRSAAKVFTRSAHYHEARCYALLLLPGCCQRSHIAARALRRTAAVLTSPLRPATRHHAARVAAAASVIDMIHLFAVAVAAPCQPYCRCCRRGF